MLNQRKGYSPQAIKQLLGLLQEMTKFINNLEFNFLCFRQESHAREGLKRRRHTLRQLLLMYLTGDVIQGSSGVIAVVQMGIHARQMTSLHLQHQCMPGYRPPPSMPSYCDPSIRETGQTNRTGRQTGQAGKTAARQTISHRQQEKRESKRHEKRHGKRCHENGKDSGQDMRLSLYL